MNKKIYLNWGEKETTPTQKERMNPQKKSYIKLRQAIYQT